MYIRNIIIKQGICGRSVSRNVDSLPIFKVEEKLKVVQRNKIGHKNKAHKKLKKTNKKNLRIRKQKRIKHISIEENRADAQKAEISDDRIGHNHGDQ